MIAWLNESLELLQDQIPTPNIVFHNRGDSSEIMNALIMHLVTLSEGSAMIATATVSHVVAASVVL